MKKILYIMSFVGCGFSLLALIVQIFPSLINYDDGTGWLSILAPSFYTIIFLVFWLVAAKGQMKNKLLYPATIGVIALIAFSLINMFFDFLPPLVAMPIIIIQEIISIIILIAWVVFYNKCLRKNIA